MRIAWKMWFRLLLPAASVVAPGGLLVCQAPAVAQVSAPIVHIQSGKIRGSGTDIHVYKGIPFASPPIGDLRWRPPQPPVRWEGVRDATQFGNNCIQVVRLASPRAPGISEDCLCLNVWTPAKRPEQKLPVMVWIHGGSFLYGSGASQLYDGERLARKGVVMVTFNYRVGVFGFLAHRLMTWESPRKASGNYGLLDQLAALRWVQTNIAAFGGDPGRVTAFGESAGGGSLSVLLVSPLAKGLFQRAILESPGAMRPLSSLADAERAGEAVGSGLAAMRRMTAEELLTKNPAPRLRRLTAPRAIGPIIDGWIVTRSEKAAYESRQVHAVPLLIGSNTDEGALFVKEWGSIKTVAELRKYAKDNFGESADEVLSLYGVSSDADVPRALKDMFADTQFHYGVRGVARAMLRLQPKTFRYYFTRKRGGADADPTHADEIPYIFGNLEAPLLGPKPAANETDRLLSEEMMGAWVRFAISGDPNGGGLPSWPAYDASTDPYMEFGDTIQAGKGQRTRYLDFIARFF